MEQKLDMVGGGWLTVGWDGPRVTVEAQRQADGQGLYKVWLLGKQGRGLLLGTLIPEGNVLRLRRTLSRGELERAGCWPPEGAEARLTFPFSNGEGWYCEYHPERFVRDSFLRGQLKGAMLCCRGEDGVRLAMPFCSSAPMVLPSLFCLARLERLDGKIHLVWQFDREGRPRVPHRTKGEGAD